MSQQTPTTTPLPAAMQHSALGGAKWMPFKRALTTGLMLSGLAVSGVALTSVTSPTAQAASLSDLFGSKSAAPAKFLPVTEAFDVSSRTTAVETGTRLAVNFDITPGHYVYKDQLTVSVPTGVTAAPFRFSQSPVSIDDPTFGQVPVFDQANMVATTLLTSDSGKRIDNAALTIGWQGCAKAGLCYPPEKIKTTVTIAATPQSALGTVANDRNAAEQNSMTPPLAVSAPISSDADAVIDYDDFDSSALESRMATNTLLGADSSVIGGNTDGSTDSISNGSISDNRISDKEVTSSNSIDNRAAFNGLENSDPFGLASHPGLALLLLFLAGLGLAFTPCVLPMLPIVANIIARQKNPTVKKSVILTTSYAIGVATAYGILGAVIAVFGESLGIIGWLQNPVILISFAIVFVLLALYMLGVYSIRLPRALSSQIQGLSQAGDSKLGSAGGSLLVGFLSALVVSPCVSAPLFGALLAVSTIGSPALGFAALFMLGFGLSVPLIVIGATQGSIMPKAGAWMNWIKQGFALLLFAVALLLLERVFISPVMLLVWALWFMVVATWAWGWLGRGRMLIRAVSLVAGIWATVLIVGAALGNDDSMHPLASVNAPSLAQTHNLSSGSVIPSNQTSDKHITTLAELDAITATTPKVVVDLTADWCVECRIMDKNLFYNRPPQMQDWQLVRLDITDTTEDSKAILARYQLFGPPTLLYYIDGQLVNKQVGEIGRQEFEQTLTALNN